MIILQSLLPTLLFLHSAFAVEWKTVFFNDSNTAIQSSYFTLLYKWDWLSCYHTVRFSGTWNSSASIPGTTETCDIWTQGAGASATFCFTGIISTRLTYLNYPEFSFRHFDSSHWSLPSRVSDNFCQSRWQCRCPGCSRRRRRLPWCHFPDEWPCKGCTAWDRGDLQWDFYRHSGS